MLLELWKHGFSRSITYGLCFLFLLYYVLLHYFLGQLTVKYRHIQMQEKSVITGSGSKDSCRKILENSI